MQGAIFIGARPTFSVRVVQRRRRPCFRKPARGENGPAFPSPRFGKKGGYRNFSVALSRGIGLVMRFADVSSADSPLRGFIRRFIALFLYADLRFSFYGLIYRSVLLRRTLSAFKNSANSAQSFRKGSILWLFRSFRQRRRYTPSSGWNEWRNLFRPQNPRLSWR